MPIRSRPAVLLAGALALGGALAGCGTTATPSDDTSAVSADSQVGTFFTLLARQQPDPQRRALRMTEPGSPAHKYVTFELALTAARDDDGVRPGRTRVVPTERGYRLCGAERERERCFGFTQIDLVGDRISSFDVDGDDIADNLSIGSGEPEELEPGGSVEFLSSYLQPSTGSYWVLLRVRSGDEPIDLRLRRARYARVGGQVLVPVSTSTLPTVPAGEEATVALVFPQADLGGTVQLHPRVGGQQVDVGLATAPYVPEVPED